MYVSNRCETSIFASIAPGLKDDSHPWENPSLKDYEFVAHKMSAGLPSASWIVNPTMLLPPAAALAADLAFAHTPAFLISWPPSTRVKGRVGIVSILEADLAIPAVVASYSLAFVLIPARIPAVVV